MVHNLTTVLLIFAAAIALLLVGCQKRGEYEPAQAKDDFNAALIFEVDGVKVYRFHDAGRRHYFAVRNTAVMLESAYYTEYNGILPEAVE
jgi:hypothetical protein